jgi:hypothetical protein
MEDVVVISVYWFAGMVFLQGNSLLGEIFWDDWRYLMVSICSASICSAISHGNNMLCRYPPLLPGMTGDISWYQYALQLAREKETSLRRSLPLCSARSAQSDPLLVSLAPRSLV